MPCSTSGTDHRDVVLTVSRDIGLLLDFDADLRMTAESQLGLPEQVSQEGVVEALPLVLLLALHRVQEGEVLPILLLHSVPQS